MTLERQPNLEIRVDDLSGVEVPELLQEHLRGMAALSPPESTHALDLDALQQPDVTFWSVWNGEDLMGCGALKELNAQHAEIKSMRTAAPHLKKGVASRLLEYILDEARRRGYAKLSLETGSMDAFEPARRLYAGFGFHYCEPFAGYVEDPNSVFMSKQI